VIPTLLAQASFSPVHAALKGGLVGVGTLLILVLMSLATWAAWLSRRKALRDARVDSGRARDAFLAASDTEAFARSAKALPDSPVKRVFLEAHQHHADLVAALAPGSKGLDGVRVSAGRELLTRTLQGAKLKEVNAARRGLVLLATVGSTAPFVGLFGTVWGIVKAFTAIGAAKTADLAIVAPGISDALVATAVGLAAAIPAVWFYNSLSGEVRKLAADIDAFNVEMLNVYDRAIAVGGGSAP
jgi:biopolymer transport protein TolQ